jgi:hypothetical protein
MNTLREEETDFLSSTILILPRKITGNPINVFLNFILADRGSHCDYSHRPPKDLATPLVTSITINSENETKEETIIIQSASASTKTKK